MLIAVLNQSTKVTDADALTMTKAIATQVRLDAAPIWDKTPATVVFYAAKDTKSLQAEVPSQAHGITIVDDIPDAPQGVLGYHTEDQGGKIWGIVAANPSLENGAQVLTGDWSVSSILSHEILEMFVDPNCNLWASNGNRRVYSVEVCDPVEAPTYEVNGVSVSNFITPAWFDPLAADNEKKAFDKLGLLKKPFTLLKGGYLVYSSSGKEQQEEGAEMPTWRLNAKSKNTHFARTNRRKAEGRFV
jgi:hypothetical protein